MLLSKIAQALIVIFCLFSLAGTWYAVSQVEPKSNEEMIQLMDFYKENKLYQK